MKRKAINIFLLCFLSAINLIMAQDKPVSIIDTVDNTFSQKPIDTTIRSTNSWVHTSDSSMATIKSIKHINLPVQSNVSPKRKSPAIAALMSTFIPASGLIYVNYKDWMYWVIHIPATYGILGYMVWRISYNLRYFNITNYAYHAMVSQDTNRIKKIDPELAGIVAGGNPTVMQNYRNQFRQNVDMNILFTVIFWGLNVVDAAVEAHLHKFNVNNNLSFKFMPAPEDMAFQSYLTPVSIFSLKYKWKYKKPYNTKLY